MSSKAYDNDNAADDMIVVGTGVFATKHPAKEGLLLTDGMIEMLHKLFAQAAKEAPDLKPNEAVTCGATCPEIYENGRRYVLQFNIQIGFVDPKSLS